MSRYDRHTELEWEIERLHNYMKDLEYDFAVARSFGERRDILKKYRKVEGEKSSLINCQEY